MAGRVGSSIAVSFTNHKGGSLCELDLALPSQRKSPPMNEQSPAIDDPPVAVEEGVGLGDGLLSTYGP